MGEHGTGKLETGKQFYLTMPLLAWWRNVALVVYCTVLYCTVYYPSTHYCYKSLLYRNVKMIQ